ncbi:MAG: N-methyl-D-aspartate receptor NMDAR2C subunit [Phycisphaerae bacterium]|nr:N-methyl-D-aspartate receptor NMDAR2C subunit [Phycisphaerae bacterium]
MTTLSDSMVTRWTRLLERLGDRGDARALWLILEALYNHPAREYHSLTHIAECLDLFDLVRPGAHNADCVEVALWLHDCIYDAAATDNEERSADVAMVMLREIGAPLESQTSVRKLVLATRHREPPASMDESLIVDIDLSILGSAPERYDAYRSQIRSEYQFVDDGAFRVGRSNFLKNMLARPRVFTTDVVRDRFEAAARANMGRELEFLNQVML